MGRAVQASPEHTCETLWRAQRPCGAHLRALQERRILGPMLQGLTHTCTAEGLLDVANYEGCLPELLRPLSTCERLGSRGVHRALNVPTTTYCPPDRRSAHPLLQNSLHHHIPSNDQSTHPPTHPHPHPHIHIHTSHIHTPTSTHQHPPTHIPTHIRWTLTSDIYSPLAKGAQ